MDDQPSPKKSLGQHWLNDQASLLAMVEAAGVQPNSTVLEIGPGLGSLTSLLVERVHSVIAVELDEKLARQLPQRVPAANLRVVQADILKFDLTELPPGYIVVANLPYYLTSNVLRLLCESTNPFSQAALLVQKEVAQRVCARPGDMSLLSVSVQCYCEATTDRVVPAELFSPPPKVDSQILRLRYRPAPFMAGLDTRHFFRVVKAGFAQRRKTLLNSLSSGLHLSREQTIELLASAGIESTVRAQNLSLDDWFRLSKLLQ